MPAPASAVPTAVPAPATAVLALAPAPPPVATVAPLPTRGPREAAAASVGAPRSNEGVAPRRPTASARVARAEPPPEPPEASISTGPPADNVYRTRRFAKLSVSPDQARIFLDGRYVGIADDWDDYGGGKTLEIGREGTHRVRLELPGHRTMHLEIVVTPAAKDDTVDIGDELKRESKVPFSKIPKTGRPDRRTRRVHGGSSRRSDLGGKPGAGLRLLLRPWLAAAAFRAHGPRPRALGLPAASPGRSESSSLPTREGMSRK